ncbi:hypothetical protein D3C75_1218960 [compost metagenome]
MAISCSNLRRAPLPAWDSPIQAGSWFSRETMLLKVARWMALAAVPVSCSIVPTKCAS